MALDLRNDNTLLYFLQNDLQRVYRRIVLDSEAGKSGLATQRTVEQVMADAEELAAAIESVGITVKKVSGDYSNVLQRLSTTESDLGSVTEAVSTIETTTADNYTTLSQLITNVSTDLGNYQKFVSGQIVRGFIEVSGKRHYGIAIGQKVTFNASETDTQGNEVFYALTGSQTLGLYTSTGWELFIDGNLIAWCDSTVENGALQVAKIIATESVSVGSWNYITDSDTFGIRYGG